MARLEMQSLEESNRWSMGKVKSSLAWPEWEQHKQQQERDKMNAIDGLNAQKIHWENVRASIFLLLKHHKNSMMYSQEEYQYWKDAWLKANANIESINKQMEVL